MATFQEQGMAARLGNFKYRVAKKFSLPISEEVDTWWYHNFSFDHQYISPIHLKELDVHCAEPL